MGIGAKIKEFRIKSNLTQKDLADKLFVTYQAVSRWENDDAEPSYDTLKQMCKIFNCTTDELFGFSEEKKEVEENQVEHNEEVKENNEGEIHPVPEVKPILGVCEMCKKSIYENSDLKRIQVSVRSGRAHEIKQKILCEECNNKRIEKDKENQKKELTYECEQILKKRRHSFIWATVVAVALFCLSIFFFVKMPYYYGLATLGAALVGYTLVGTLILDNTFVADLWSELASLGCIKLPGIIFTLDFDGIKFFIIVKIIFAIIGSLLSILALIFATLVAGVISLVVYPIALYLNFREVKNIKNSSI